MTDPETTAGDRAAAFSAALTDLLTKGIADRMLAIQYAAIQTGDKKIARACKAHLDFAVDQVASRLAGEVSWTRHPSSGDRARRATTGRRGGRSRPGSTTSSGRRSP
jgi:hypothetical protein